MNLVFEVVIVEGDWFVLGGDEIFFWGGGGMWRNSPMTFSRGPNHGLK